MRQRSAVILLLLLTAAGYDAHASRHVAANDSLLAVWNDVDAQDTVRLDALLLLVRKGYLYSIPDSARHFAGVAFGLAEKGGHGRQMADAINLKGISFDLQGDFEQALAAYQQSLSLREKFGLISDVAKSHNNLGLLLRAMGDHVGALAHFTKSLNIKESLSDSVGKALTLENMALVFMDKGDHARAIGLFMDGMKMKRAAGNMAGVANSLTNIGNVHYQQGDFPQALYYQKEALSLRQSMGNQLGMATSLNSIGSIYGSMGHTDSALASIENALLILRQLGDRKGTATALQNMAQMHGMMDDHSLALDLYRQSLRIREEIGDLSGMFYSLGGIGQSHAALGSHRQAVVYLGKALAAARDGQNIQGIQKIAELLYRSHQSLGDYRSALEMHELYISMRDSIMREENQKEVMRQQFQYDFEKKEALLAAEQEKKDAVAREALMRQKLVRNGFMGGFVVMLLFAGVFLVQRNRIGREKQRSEELLLNILPEEVAEELKAKGEADARLIDHVTVLFTDFKGFTSLSEKVTPRELVRDLHECFSAFDHICAKYGIEKIKTIGDAYMAAGGLPTPNSTHATDVLKAALEMAEVVQQGKAKKIAEGLPFFEIRIGVHTGPVVAGIVGVKKFQYDIWGDTVNTASRMESSGEVGRVNISQSTYELVKDEYACEYRGEVEVKGKGKLGMYFVEGAKTT